MGHVIAWRRSLPKKRWSVIGPDEDLPAELESFDGAEDCFIAVNEFRKWRTIKLLVRLRACFVDIDNCRTVDAAMLRVSDAQLPPPSYAVQSGNGVHLYWYLEPAPAQALPLWQAIQQKLVSALDADAAAKDCTRVLRLAGSVNTKNGKRVEGERVTGERWTLHELADEVIGPRPTLDTPKGSTAHRKAVRSAVRSATASLNLWHRRWTDLTLIADHHARESASGIPEGNRDKLLFLMATALSWFRPASGLMEEIQQVASALMPSLTPDEVATYMSPIVKRACDAVAGRTVLYDGLSKDPRYAFKTDTIRAWIKPLLTPEVECKLRVLVSVDRLEAREVLRQRSRSRVDEGRYKLKREEYEAASNARRVRALQLRNDGWTVKDIQEELKVSQSEVYRLLRPKGHPPAPKLPPAPQ